MLAALYGLHAFVRRSIKTQGRWRLMIIGALVLNVWLAVSALLDLSQTEYPWFVSICFLLDIAAAVLMYDAYSKNLSMERTLRDAQEHTEAMIKFLEGS